MLASNERNEGAARRLPLLSFRGLLFYAPQTRMLVLGLLSGLVFVAGVTTAAPHADADDVHVDFVLPLTGPQARLGQSLQRAAALALSDVNRAHSSPSRNFRARFHDDGCSLAGGRAAAKALDTVAPVVRVVVGVPCEAGLAGLVSTSPGLPPLLVLTTARAKTNSQPAGPRTRMVFSLHTPVSPGRGLAAVLSELPPTARLAFVRDKTHYAISLVQEVLGALQQAGRKPVGVETISGGDKDFGALARRLAASETTHVVVVTFPGEAGLLVADLVNVIPGVEIIGSDTLAVPEFGAALGSTAPNVRVFIQAQPQMAATAQDVVGRFRAAGIPDSRHAIGIYAAVELWAAAMTAAGTVEAEAVAGELRARTHMTAIGGVAFDRDGSSTQLQGSLYHWTDGRWLPFERANAAPQRP